MFQCFIEKLNLQFYTNYLYWIYRAFYHYDHILLNCKHLYFIVDIKILWSQISRDYVNNHVEMYSTVQYSTPLQLGIANVEMYQNGNNATKACLFSASPMTYLEAESN